MSNPATEEVHGHEVMHMMLEQPKGFSRDSLIDAIHQRFGADTKFYTCSAEHLSAAELVDYLEGKNKFSGPEDNFITSADPCVITSKLISSGNLYLALIAQDKRDGLHADFFVDHIHIEGDDAFLLKAIGVFHL